jgi:hypothetical protein
MKFRYLILLIGFCINSSWADFSNASVQLHPFYPHDGPFVIEISGNWPSDCHPGEQRPVIQAYDGNSVVIEFEIIIVHVTCNDVATPYRVLVDMSDVVGTVAGSFPDLQITVRFGGAEFSDVVALDCGPVIPCQESPVEDIKPARGLFHNAGLQNQALLLARENQWMAVYPLVYDDAGDSEWLIAGGEIVEDVYFGNLYELTGGQCLECPPPEQPPREEIVGKLTLLMDSEGTIQAKVNDGSFTQYQSFLFGYRTFRVGPAGEYALIDLEGRWGISENRGTNPPLGDLTEFFPGVFDVVREDIVTAGNGVQPDGQVSYLVSTPTGETLGQLVCRGRSEFGVGDNICEFIDPTDAAEPLFLFYQDGPSSLAIEYGRPLIAIGTAPGGKAIRLD